MAETLSSLSLTELEQRLTEIDTQLQNLAHYTPRGGFGRVGYRSAEYDAPDHRTSLQIDLLAKRHVDLLVLVPTIIRDPVKGFRPDGFPLALRILDENGSLLAEQDFSGQHHQRIAPFTIPLDGKPVSKLSVEATKLSPRAFDGKFVFQLAELLVFDGSENVALERTAKPSTFPADAVDAWAPAFVTDGSLPYLMNSARGLPSTAYLSPRRDPSITKLLSLSIDLKESYPLTQLYLHAVDQSDTIPQSAPDGIGMPHHLLVEGANQSDYSDARTLLQIHCTSVFESDPILMRRLGGEHVRYVRLTAVDPYLFPFYDGLHPRIGFSEIEIFSKGKNVTAGKIFVVPGEQRDHRRPAAALTDQRNLFGEILPTRQWMEELALRNALETERPLVAAELATRYARQKQTLRRMIGLATLLAVGIGFTLLIDRIRQLRKLAQLKERFSADLHDELGANLHTIGLLSQLIERKAGPLPGETSTYLQRIQSVTEQSGVAVRNIAELQNASGMYGNLEADMQRAASRTLANVDHDLEVKGIDLLNRFPPKKKVDLFLFYKECLINVCKHSGASRVQTRLMADRRKAVLTISDNGRGLPESLDSTKPTSLERRAKLLGAQLQVQTVDQGGCCVSLTLRLPRRFKET